MNLLSPSPLGWPDTQAITGRTNESQISTHAISQGYVKGNYVGDPSGTFHVRMG